jgi:hypothetical protein
MKSGQRLFNLGKVGCFVDGYGPKVEKRRGEEVTCLSVQLRVQPFDAKLASSLDNGVGGESNIRSTIFNLNTAEPRANFTRHDFKLGLPPQNLLLFASPDTEDSRVALTQAKITGCYVRTQKDMNALAFVFKASFGPVGRDQLELVHKLHGSQTFVTFEEGEPLLDGENDEDEVGEAEEVQTHAPMFNDDGEETAAAAAAPAAPAPKKAKKPKPGVERAHRPLHSHQSKKNAKRGRR